MTAPTTQQPAPPPPAPAPGLQLRRGRPLTGAQAWALAGCGLVLGAGTLWHTPWIVPAVLAAALVAPGYAVLATAAAAVEYDSGEGLWRTLALRVVASVALWTALPTGFVVVGLDPVHAVRLVALALVGLGVAGVVGHSRAAGVPAVASLVGALRTWRAVLGLRHVAAPLVGAVVVVAALLGAVALADGGPAGTASSRTPFVSLSVAGGDGVLAVGARNRTTVDVVVTGSRLPAAGDLAARVEVWVDGRQRPGRDVTVPATGSTTVRLTGAWGRCWQRASVVLVPVAGTGTTLAGLVPRPLTLDGPGAGAPAGTACAR
jgi:hypothetical protein